MLFSNLKKVRVIKKLLLTVVTLCDKLLKNDRYL